MNDNNELQNFRAGFCEKAAELGIRPSELLCFTKQSGIMDELKSILGTGKDVAATAAKLPYWAGLALLAGGAGLGGLAAYGVAEGRKALDPSNELLGDEEDPVAEAKKLQLIAKYRNAVDQINAHKQ